MHVSPSTMIVAVAAPFARPALAYVGAPASSHTVASLLARSRVADAHVVSPPGRAPGASPGVACCFFTRFLGAGSATATGGSRNSPSRSMSSRAALARRGAGSGHLLLHLRRKGPARCPAAHTGAEHQWALRISLGRPCASLGRLWFQGASELGYFLRHQQCSTTGARSARHSPLRSCAPAGLALRP